MLPQSHVKVPGHSVKSEDGRLHLTTLTEPSQSGLSRQGVGTYHENKLKPNVSGLVSSSVGDLSPINNKRNICPQ